MADRFSLSEVMRMAEEIERNGAIFYKEGAKITDNQITKDIMTNLAEQEKMHESLFGQMRQQFCGKNDLQIADPDGQVQAYIKSIASTHVFNVNKDVSELLMSVQSPESILQLAIGFEKDTIAFFSAMKNAVKQEYRDKLDVLVQEEIGHIKLLQQAIDSLKKL